MTESERYKALLPDAKVIRDEVGDSKNTAYRVGKLFFEIISAALAVEEEVNGKIDGINTSISNIQNALNNQKISSAEVNIDSYEIKVKLNDASGGNVVEFSIPSATALSAGLISAEDKKKLGKIQLNHSIFMVSGTPYSKSYPNIDTKNGILDLGEDPILIVDGVEWAFKGVVDESIYRNIPITPEQGSSSALILLFSNKDPRTFKFVTFISDELDDGVIVGTVRRSTFTGEVFNADFPFTVMMDGKLQGIPEVTGGGTGDVGEPTNTSGIKSVTVDLDNDSETEIWEKISTNTALVYFVYKGDKIYSALVSAGKSSYSIMYMTDDGMRSTRIRKSGGGQYVRDDYYTEMID